MECVIASHLTKPATSVENQRSLGCATLLPTTILGLELLQMRMLMTDLMNMKKETGERPIHSVVPLP
jgi:hypothetical protein